MGLTWTEPVAADTIHLAGVVPAKSGVRLIQRQSAVPADSRQPLRDVILVSLVLQTNNRLSYKFSVLSDNARENGSTALVNSETGTAIPYTLKLGDQEMHFQDGTAVVDAAATKGSKTADLKISTGGNSGPNGEQFQERLILVMSFN